MGGKMPAQRPALLKGPVPADAAPAARALAALGAASSLASSPSWLHCALRQARPATARAFTLLTPRPAAMPTACISLPVRASTPGGVPSIRALGLHPLPAVSEVGGSDRGHSKEVHVASATTSPITSRTRRGADLHASNPLLALTLSWTSARLSAAPSASRSPRVASGAVSGAVGVP